MPDDKHPLTPKGDMSRIYAEGELEHETTVRNFRTVQTQGAMGSVHGF